MDIQTSVSSEQNPRAKSVQQANTVWLSAPMTLQGTVVGRLMESLQIKHKSKGMNMVAHIV